MCGYCTEEIALDNLRDEVRGNLQMKQVSYSMGRYCYLRETPDFISSLDRIRRSLAQKKLALYSEVPPAVVLYRGLEILVQQGFTSSAYQNLLKKPLYRDAIAASCSDEKQKEFELATEGLKIENLGLLYNAETFFWGERSKQLRTLAHTLPSCRNMLKHYISWWFDWHTLQEKEFVESMVKTSINDPFYDVTDEDRSRFYLLTRAFYFSILMVGSCSAGKKMLQAIVQRSPAACPCFDGEELWLQRVASLKLYDLEGFDAFFKYLSSIQDEHYFYIDQVRGFSIEQKQMLLDEVRRHQVTGKRSNSKMLWWLNSELGKN